MIVYEIILFNYNIINNIFFIMFQDNVNVIRYGVFKLF